MLPGFTRLKIIWNNVIILEHFVKSITYTLKPLWAIPHSDRSMCFPWSMRLFYLMYFQVLVKFSLQNSFGGYCYSLNFVVIISICFTYMLSPKGYNTIIGWCTLGEWKIHTKHFWIDSIIGNTLFSVSTIARELTWIRIGYKRFMQPYCDLLTLSM